MMAYVLLNQNLPVLKLTSQCQYNVLRECIPPTKGWNARALHIGTNAPQVGFVTMKAAKLKSSKQKEKQTRLQNNNPTLSVLNNLAINTKKKS
jgi:hypothetical protein